MNLRQQLLRAAAAAFFLMGSGFVQAEMVEGKVVGVSDGDTVTILQINGDQKVPRKIRISGIDAPEKSQAFGNVAKDAMSQLAFGKTAQADCRTTDRYARSVCLVRVGQIDVGLRLIEEGLAWHFKKYQNTQPPEERVSYNAAEVTARAARRGLWQDTGTAAPPLAPWDWRAAKKAGEVETAL